MALSFCDSNCLRMKLWAGHGEESTCLTINSVAKCWTAHAVCEYSEIKRPPHAFPPLEPASLPLCGKAFPVGYLYYLGPHPQLTPR